MSSQRMIVLSDSDDSCEDADTSEVPRDRSDFARISFRIPRSEISNLVEQAARRERRKKRRERKQRERDAHLRDELQRKRGGQCPARGSEAVAIVDLCNSPARRPVQPPTAEQFRRGGVIPVATLPDLPGPIQPIDLSQSSSTSPPLLSSSGGHRVLARHILTSGSTHGRPRGAEFEERPLSRRTQSNPIRRFPAWPRCVDLSRSESPEHLSVDPMLQQKYPRHSRLYYNIRGTSYPATVEHVSHSLGVMLKIAESGDERWETDILMGMRHWPDCPTPYKYVDPDDPNLIRESEEAEESQDEELQAASEAAELTSGSGSRLFELSYGTDEDDAEATSPTITSADGESDVETSERALNDLAQTELPSENPRVPSPTVPSTPIARRSPAEQLRARTSRSSSMDVGPASATLPHTTAVDLTASPPSSDEPSPAPRNRSVLGLHDRGIELSPGLRRSRPPSLTPNPRPQKKRRLSDEGIEILESAPTVHSPVAKEDPDLGNQDVIKALQSKIKCPVCMVAATDLTSTKCGHLFCRKCIRKAIQVNHKCPTCRTKLNLKDAHRIYF